jgi:putative serine protease PepD
MTDERDDRAHQPDATDGAADGAQPHQGEPVCDPWAPPRETPVADPGTTDPSAPGASAPAPSAPTQPVDTTPQWADATPQWAEDRTRSQAQDHTQPVDLNQTQEITPGQPPTHGEQAAYGGSAVGGAHNGGAQPTGWPADPAAHQPPGTDAHAGQQASPGTGWDPISAPVANAGYAGSPQPWVGERPVEPSAPQQKGPGWGALVAVAAAAALVAAILGGMFGGWLGATDRVDFGSLDRTPSSIPQAGPGSTARPEGSVASIAAKALPSVVTIKVRGADGAGTGSGFVLDKDGHIITNNHVVAGAADNGTIKIELSDGNEIDATIVGRDASYDLAVLRTSRRDLEPLTMGVSKDVVVGDQVIAVGAPLGLESTVTSGIVSALNRPVSPGGDGNTQSYINAIQTDAAINPGNSGGPLLNMQGQVIGVNTAIARIPGATDTQSGNIGVGFSIPSDQVVRTAEQLIKTGSAQHPVIGVVLDRQFTGDGVKVLERRTADSGAPVEAGGPADKAGIKPGDVIVEFDGKKVTNADDLVVAIRSKNVGDTVPMKVRRGSETIDVKLTLAGKSGS